MAKKAASKPVGKRSKRISSAASGAESMIEDVRQYVQLMVENDLTELNVEEGAKKILLRRGGVDAVVGGAAGVTELPRMPAPTGKGISSGPIAQAAEELLEVKSPMVGTFYNTPSPDSDPYVSMGDRISPDDVVGIVEAMKVMNEIKAECSGTIAEICVKNAQPVEFGQVLLRVRPT